MKIVLGNKKGQIHFVCWCALLLTFSIAGSSRSWPQTPTAKPGSAYNSSSQEVSSGQGFSIESEMLTYRGLESNSEAVACDVAAYLRGGSANFKAPPSGSVCAVIGGANNEAGVVILPFDQSQLNDFRIWRVDMAIMSELRGRAQIYCPESQPIKVEEKGAAAPALAYTPAGSALSLAVTALGLVSSETSALPVGGTIQDQAFMDGVARELRSLGVPVLMPATYIPYSLTPLVASRSPFVANLDKLYKVRKCLEDKNGKGDPSVEKIISDIDAYLAALGISTAASARADEPVSAKAEEGRTSIQTPAASAAASAPSSAKTTAEPPSPTSLTHLMAVLSADGLAQKMGVDPDTGLLSDDAVQQHPLLLRALESGGTIEKRANILGSKVRYSGGSVGSYALFTIEGDLECSGNVYEYGGSFPAKDFAKGLRSYLPDPGQQFIFQRGSCTGQMIAGP